MNMVFIHTLLVQNNYYDYQRHGRTTIDITMMKLLTDTHPERAHSGVNEREVVEDTNNVLFILKQVLSTQVMLLVTKQGKT